MDNLEVVVTFANDEKLYIKQDAIIFPVRLVEHKNEKFCSTSEPIVLEEEMHHSEGLIPALTSVFALNEFFFLSEEGQTNRTVYKTGSIVSLEQRKQQKAGIGRFF
ncbi:hypothetical protein ACW0TQ_08125 [Oceanobacillus sp. M60]|uniref:hypothetical protein n=1 Tax=Oceanobacillus TaxID=182709 RepID=UPI0021170AB0|nr:hypothetical protein [Oceanobacillus oncorhynchi]UUI41177.1 hypothetical protein NP440_06315 [Oceanobacillus oncorhynchi]